MPSHASVDRRPADGPLQTPESDDLCLHATTGSLDSAETAEGRIEGEEVSNDGSLECAMDDNTAAGMSFMQEESLYTDGRAILTRISQDKPQMLDDRVMAEKENIPYTMQPSPSLSSEQLSPSPAPTHSDGTRAGTSSPEITDSRAEGDEREVRVNSTHATGDLDRPVEDEAALNTPEPQSPSHPYFHHTSSSTNISTSLPRTPSWDFTRSPVSNRYPSSLLRPGSKFTGTQQSDKQIYNVDVDILTVNTPQCTLSGYLRICDLTEDTPVLTTYFTGEIIGHTGDLSQPQKYSFKTSHPAWGATDKTDLVHWARFPAWRPLSRDAKHDLNFTYPVPGLSNVTANGLGTSERNAWWQQDHIFMRWKEWFLVPDHTLRSIPGASFEGFYYICFNQVEGRVSGIYFHAKSEKYQQLELKHVFDRGVVPSMEFR